LWFVVITMWCGPSPSQCLGFYGGCLDETVRNILGPLRGWEGPASQDIHQSKRKNEIEWVKKDKFGHDWQPIEPSFSSIALTAPAAGSHCFSLFSLPFMAHFCCRPRIQMDFTPIRSAASNSSGSVAFCFHCYGGHDRQLSIRLSPFIAMVDTIRGLALWPWLLATSERLVA
jgi:hypothetical protein